MDIRQLVQAGFGALGLRVTRLRNEPTSHTQLDLFFLALKARGFSPKHIIDVGANHGFWTRTSIKYFPDSHYTLIEPQDYLKRQVNDLITPHDSKIHWIGAGVADTPGTLPFTIARYDHSSTFVLTPEQAKTSLLQQINVPVLTLNEIVRKRNAPFPNMVKIDAEGYDLKVIAGASELLGRTDIFLLETAICAPGMENNIQKVIDTMSQAGYHVIDIPGLNRSPKYGVLWLCDLAFLRNESPLLAEISSYD
jgi:FkbM family methyltransferase